MQRELSAVCKGVRREDNWLTSVLNPLCGAGLADKAKTQVTALVLYIYICDFAPWCDWLIKTTFILPFNLQLVGKKINVFYSIFNEGLLEGGQPSAPLSFFGPQAL